MPIYIYKENSQISTNAIRNNKAVKAIYAKEQEQEAVCVWGVNLNIVPFTYTKSETSITITGLKGGVKMEHLRVPETIEELPVEGITYGAFEKITIFKSIKLPNTLTFIGAYAFYMCTGLTSLTIGNSATSIGDSAFRKCTSLTSATIGNGVTDIDDLAFFGCIGLTNIVIPDNVRNIYRSAFYDCTGLMSITIPNSVTRIGDYTFKNCTSLTNITFNGTQAQWNAITKGTDWNYNTGNYTIHCTDGDIPK